MSELTPERVRDAAEVVRAYSMPPHVWTAGEATGMTGVARILDNIAVGLERERTAEAKREKRVKELAHEMRVAAIPAGSGQHWEAAAEALLDRYPALADGPES